MGSSASSGTIPSETVAFVDAEIANQKVVVFSKSYCPYCSKAKRALQAAGAKDIMVVHELDHMDRKGGDIQNYLAHKTGRRTVPSVFVGGENIGGGDETDALHRKGKLAKMVANTMK